MLRSPYRMPFFGSPCNVQSRSGHFRAAAFVDFVGKMSYNGT